MASATLGKGSARSSSIWRCCVGHSPTSICRPCRNFRGTPISLRNSRMDARGCLWAKVGRDGSEQLRSARAYSPRTTHLTPAARRRTSGRASRGMPAAAIAGVTQRQGQPAYSVACGDSYPEGGCRQLERGLGAEGTRAAAEVMCNNSRPVARR